MLFINPRSGGGKAVRADLPGAARERGIEPVVLTPGDDLEVLARGAVESGADALGMAGGDGSMAAVASAAAAHGLPFVCVPAGTRNHFARDLRLAPDDVVGGLDAFTDGVERTIDVGEVNGRPFLNNVSIGIYGDAVQREGYRDAKLRTLCETAAEVLGPGAPPPPALRVVDDIGLAHEQPAVVLVSNNPYALDGPVGRGTPVPWRRPALDSGELGVLVLHEPRDGGRGAGRAWSARFLVVLASQQVAAGVDGEAIRLDPPLRFTIRPRGLRVRIPFRQPRDRRPGAGTRR